MIDLHTHILPELDDGAADFDQSVEMARLAAESGTTFMLATVHSYAKRGFYELLPEDIKSAADELNRRLADAQIELSVGTGMEVLLDPGMLPLIEEGRMLTLGDSRWLLVEFCGSESAKELIMRLRAVVDMGYMPLIAHAERYRAIQKHPELASVLIDMGCAIQVNARSLTGETDRKFVKTAHKLCQKGWVQVVASDAHNTSTRPPLLKRAWEWLAVQYSATVADRLINDNPRTMLAGGKPV